MTVNEKLSLCSDGFLHLFKEGVFWIGYEMSAYLLCLVRPLQTTKKPVKVAGMEVVRVGFPQTSLEGFLERFRVCERTESYIRAEPSEIVGEAVFEQWKQELPAYAPKCVAIVENETPAVAPIPSMALSAFTPDALYKRVREFRLSAATPMECMRFVEELQKGM
ncbi:MAG: hypothetical protein LBR26_08405 [Prevotella sp.]|jgi:hypothetical protein|nr:hypothetical protein [Prevotella sp.]